MKTICKLFIFTMFLSLPLYSYAKEENNKYIDEENSSEYFETSDEDNIYKENEKVESKTETDKYQYDIEIYPYVSVKYTSSKTKKEDF